MTGHDAHLIAARPAVVPSQGGRRFAIARVPRLPRWLRQPRHGGGACWRRNTLGVRSATQEVLGRAPRARSREPTPRLARAAPVLMPSSDVVPFILMGGGVLLVFAAYVWLQDELDGPNRRTWLLLDLIASGKPFGFTLLGLMAGGAWMIYLGWKSLR